MLASSVGKRDMELLDRVQGRATRMIKALSLYHLCPEESLRQRGLEKREFRGFYQRAFKEGCEDIRARLFLLVSSDRTGSNVPALLLALYPCPHHSLDPESFFIVSQA